MVVGISSGLSVCLAVPSVLVASDDVVCGVVVITDCEVESISAGATILVGIVEGVGARGVVIVVMPCIGIAGILKDVLVCAVVDGKV